MKVRNEGRAALEFVACILILFASVMVPSCGPHPDPPVPPSPPPLPDPTPVPDPVPKPIPVPTDDVSAALLLLHNAERAKKNLPPLTIDPRLTQSAAAHSQYMANVGKLAHFGINDGTPWTRIDKTGYQYSAASENVAWNQPDSATVVKDWMSSPGHRANILGNFKDVGFGMAKGRAGDAYWTSVFAYPQTPRTTNLPQVKTLPPTAAPVGTEAPPDSPEATKAQGPERDPE